MSNVVPIKPHETIEDEASLWVVKIDRGLSDVEKEEFNTWLSTSKTHREEFFSMVKFWDEADVLSKLANICPREKVETIQKEANPHRVFSALAASFILFVCAIGFFTLGKRNEMADSPAPILFNAQYSTPVGEQVSKALPDGSVIDLNTQSEVAVNFDENFRLIKLIRGELIIDVAHNTRQPLVVMAGDQLVKAVGTAFNVRVVDDEHVKVVITEGHVVVSQYAAQSDESEKIRKAFSQNTGKLAMSQGDLAILKGRERYLKRLNNDEIEMELAWKSGNLVFNGESLEYVVNEITRYTGIEFEIADEDLKNIKIAGIFQTGDIDGFILSLEENLEVKAEKLTGNRIKLEKP